MPRPRQRQPCPRSTTMALHVPRVSRASSLRPHAPAWTPATMRGAMGLPPLGTSSAKGRQPSPRRHSPSAPGSLAGPPETVAGNGSSPARNGSPLAGKQVFDNGNTSGHVPQHARQLCRGPGDGGRRRVSRRVGIGSSITATHRDTCPGTPGNFAGVPGVVAGDGSLAGRKSGLSPAGNRVFDTGYISGHRLPPLFSPIEQRCTAPQHPRQAHGHHAAWPHPRPGRGHPPKEQ